MVSAQPGAGSHRWLIALILNNHGNASFFPTPSLIHRSSSQNVTFTLSRSQVKRYSDVLGVSITASVPKLKQAFYKKSFSLHPDRNKSAQAQRQFTEVSEAYEALMIHKRNTGGSGHHSFNAKTEYASESAFRPWNQRKYREKSAPPPPPFESATNSEHYVDRFQGNISDNTTSENFTNAGEWCHQFYQQQLKKDFTAIQKEKAQREKQRQETSGNYADSCIVM